MKTQRLAIALSMLFLFAGFTPADEKSVNPKIVRLSKK